MEWNLDLLDLLVEFLRVNLVDEFSLMILSMLHLKSQDSEHKELLFRVTSQVNVLGSIFHGIWFFNRFTLLLNELYLHLNFFVRFL